MSSDNGTDRNGDSTGDRTATVSYDTVVFDNDGVLVVPPPRSSQLRATRRAFEAVGVSTVADEHVGAIVDGIHPDELYALCAEYELDPETFWAKREHFDERSQVLEFEAGSRSTYDDVAIVPELSQTCGLVSNNHQSTVEFVLSHFGLQSAFDVCYGRPRTIESLAEKKPEPTFIDAALSALEPENALYVGDSETDLIAAERAGIDAAFLRRDHRAETELSVEPTYELADLYELQALLEN
ncbi:HAD family hydrolase [Halocatena halophila]|uniref:HAD family hydrolase n=1 Tax=Halocatena halophila TaxID=2814576 RepID=UPI002ED14AE8